jgi:hypothetical protein
MLSTSYIYIDREVLICVAGVEHVGGDMFRRVPKGDAIFMKVSFLFCSFGDSNASWG